VSPPAQPAPPALAGATPGELEASRRFDGLRIVWTDVPGALTYDLRFSAFDVRLSAVKGAMFSGLIANRAHQVEVRAVNLDGASAWSQPATFFTRPPTPAPPVLDGPAARQHDRLTMNWAPLPGLTTYDLRVNGVEIAGPLARPFTLDRTPAAQPLPPNSRFDVELRARDDAAGGASEWSAPVAFVTRPPRPDVPARVHSDLSGWAISLRWLTPVGFPGGGSSFVRLFRRMDGDVAVIADGSATAGGLRVHRHVDSRQRMSSLKRYHLQIVVPANAVPAPILEDGGENRSFESDGLEARLPFCLTTPRKPPPPLAAGVASFRRGRRRM
jgi:hypothetical protein